MQLSSIKLFHFQKKTFGQRVVCAMAMSEKNNKNYQPCSQIGLQIMIVALYRICGDKIVVLALEESMGGEKNFCSQWLILWVIK